MKDLPDPDMELARRIFEEVPFEYRLTLFHYGRRTGPVCITIYTMWEILGFLELPNPQLDLEKVADWLESVVEDYSLGLALRELAGSGMTQEKKLERVKDLISLRLRQGRRREEARS